MEREFRRNLECGILAHGFARARCGQCGHDFLIAFSCGTSRSSRTSNGGMFWRVPQPRLSGSPSRANALPGSLRLVPKTTTRSGRGAWASVGPASASQRHAERKRRDGGGQGRDVRLAKDSPGWTSSRARATAHGCPWICRGTATRDDSGRPAAGRRTRASSRPCRACRGRAVPSACPSSPAARQWRSPSGARVRLRAR